MARLDLSNRSDGIYAIVRTDVKRDSTDCGAEHSEAYSDFMYHTAELQKHVRVNVKSYCASSVYFMSKEVPLTDSTRYVYVFIRRGANVPKIIDGVDTWPSLKVQAEKYFGNAKH